VCVSGVITCVGVCVCVCMCMCVRVWWVCNVKGHHRTFENPLTLHTHPSKCNVKGAVMCVRGGWVCNVIKG